MRIDWIIIEIWTDLITKIEVEGGGFFTKSYLKSPGNRTNEQEFAT